MAIFTPIYSACKNAVHYIMGNHHKKKPETDANKWARKLTQWTAVVAIVGIATVIVLYRTDETARLRRPSLRLFHKFHFYSGNWSKWSCYSLENNTILAE